jgi:hypothetical protein
MIGQILTSDNEATFGAGPFDQDNKSAPVRSAR